MADTVENATAVLDELTALRGYNWFRHKRYRLAKLIYRNYSDYGLGYTYIRHITYKWLESLVLHRN
jgi:hypothetical protein